MQQYLTSLVIDIYRLSVWLVLLAIIFIPLERLCAQRKQPILRQQLFADLGYYFLNSLLPNLLLIIPLSLIAAIVHRIEPSGLYAGVAALPARTRLVLAIVVGEFATYWGHRWMHEQPFLWRFQAIHHSAKEMDWLVNTRAHPLDLFFTRICGLVPIYLLGLAQPTSGTVDIVPLLYSIIGTVWSFFVHANIRWRFGWLERVLATPAFHHWHHTNDGEQFVNKNYAAIFPWVDLLFGTFYLPKQRFPQAYGIATPMSASLTEQLLQPLIKGKVGS